MSTVKKIPMRKCTGCGEMKEKKAMMRVLKCEEGIILDTTGKKNGRGAYLCKSGTFTHRNFFYCTQSITS